MGCPGWGWRPSRDHSLVVALRGPYARLLLDHLLRETPAVSLSGGAAVGATLSAVPTSVMEPRSLERRRIRAVPGRGDRTFRGLNRLAATAVMAIFAAIGLFLALRAAQAISEAKLSFLTTQVWQPDTHHFGIAGVLTGTVLIALVAIFISVPISLGLSLFISEISPQRIKRTLISIVDLMAAVPSVVYGLWGLDFFQGHLIGVARWLSTWLAWIPIFKVTSLDPFN